jgi:hypothetical protein
VPVKFFKDVIFPKHRDLCAIKDQPSSEDVYLVIALLKIGMAMPKVARE